MKAISKNLTSKKMQIDKAQATTLAIVVGAAIVSVFSLVTAHTFFSQAGYLSRVAGEKEKAVKQLKANKDAISTLVKSYKEFSGQNPNLIGGTNKGNGERDGDNGRLVLDALPSKYDFPALTTSIEKLLKGYSISSIAGTDDAATQAVTTTGAAPVEMPFTLAVTADYKSTQNLLTTFEKSIRPFQVQSIEMSGTNTTLKVNITAKTFYQPAKDLGLETKVVK